MGESKIDNKEEIGSSESFIFACYQGIERSRKAAQLLRDEGYDAKTFGGGMNRMMKLTAEDLRHEIPKGSKLILIYDHRNGNKPTGQQIAVDLCEAHLREAGINFQEMTTTQLEIFLSGLGVQDVGFRFNSPFT